jgi:hypothetical protein
MVTKCAYGKVLYLTVADSVTDDNKNKQKLLPRLGRAFSFRPSTPPRQSRDGFDIDVSNSITKFRENRIGLGFTVVTLSYSCYIQPACELLSPHPHLKPSRFLTTLNSPIRVSSSPASMAHPSNPLSPPSLLALPSELRHQIYSHLIPRPVLAYLGIKSHGSALLPFFTVEPRNLSDDRSYIPSRMWEALDLRILLVCRQIYGELVALLGERMGLDITLFEYRGDGNGDGKGSRQGKGEGEGKTEETIRAVVPAWFAQRVRTVRCYSDSENVKGTLNHVFPALKTVVLHDRVVEPLLRIMEKTSRSLNRVEKVEVMAAVRDRAVKLFEEQVAGFDARVPERRFRITREVKFGRFRVLATVEPASLALPSRWMLGHTFVSCWPHTKTETDESRT